MCPLCQLSNQDTIFHVKFFYTVVAKCYKKYMPPINAFCINCNILIKPVSVDAFCTKNFSLMQNASTLPTHFVTKKSKCTNCNIDAKCVVSKHEQRFITSWPGLVLYRDSTGCCGLCVVVLTHYNVYEIGGHDWRTFEHVIKPISRSEKVTKIPIYFNKSHLHTRVCHFENAILKSVYFLLDSVLLIKVLDNTVSMCT